MLRELLFGASAQAGRDVRTEFRVPIASHIQPKKALLLREAPVFPKHAFSLQASQNGSEFSVSGLGERSSLQAGLAQSTKEEQQMQPARSRGAEVSMPMRIYWRMQQQGLQEYSVLTLLLAV